MKFKFTAALFLISILVFTSLFVGFVYAKSTFHKVTPNAAIKPPVDIIGDGSYPPLKPIGRGKNLINADLTPPAVLIWYAAGNYPNPVVGEPVTFSVRATDNVQMDYAEIYIDGILVKACPYIATTPPYSIPACLYVANFLATGNHTYKAIAYDNSSNWAADPPTGTKILTIVADTVKPSMVWLAHSPVNPLVGQTVTISGTACDTGGIKNATIYLDGSAVKTNTYTDLPNCISISYSASFGAAGSHTYYMTAADTSNNVGRNPSAGTKSFTVS